MRRVSISMTVTITAVLCRQSHLSSLVMEILHTIRNKARVTIILQFRARFWTTMETTHKRRWMIRTNWNCLQSSLNPERLQTKKEDQVCYPNTGKCTVTVAVPFSTRQCWSMKSYSSHREGNNMRKVSSLGRTCWINYSQCFKRVNTNILQKMRLTTNMVE